MEHHHAGFHLWRDRKDNYGRYIEIVRLTPQLIKAQGTLSTGFIYHYTDADVVSSHTYYYGLEVIDQKGIHTFDWSNIRDVTPIF